MYGKYNLNPNPNPSPKPNRLSIKIHDQKYLSIPSLQTDYLNIDGSTSFGINIERANTVQKKRTFCGGTNHSV